MKIIPLGAESLGVRSMATYVEVAGRGILIDPGATLAPSRFGLPPADEEWEALRRANDRISAYALRAELIFVSHYHEDHFRSDPVSYAGRRVLVKDPRRMVQGLQARRDVRWRGRVGRLWGSGRVVTAGACLGVEPAALETRRAELWGRVRKPAAPSGRAIMTRRSSSGSSSQPTTRRLAKGGTP